MNKNYMNFLSNLSSNNINNKFLFSLLKNSPKFSNTKLRLNTFSKFFIIGKFSKKKLSFSTLGNKHSIVSNVANLYSEFRPKSRFFFFRYKFSLKRKKFQPLKFYRVMNPFFKLGKLYNKRVEKIVEFIRQKKLSNIKFTKKEYFFYTPSIIFHKNQRVDLFEFTKLNSVSKNESKNFLSINRNISVFYTFFSFFNVNTFVLLYLFCTFFYIVAKKNIDAYLFSNNYPIWHSYFGHSFSLGKFLPSFAPLSSRSVFFSLKKGQFSNNTTCLENGSSSSPLLINPKHQRKLLYKKIKINKIFSNISINFGLFHLIPVLLEEELYKNKKSV